MFGSFSIQHANQQTKTEATRALMSMLFIGFLPIVLGFIGLAFRGDIKTTFIDVFLTGDLYFYAMSFCASLYVAAQLDVHETDRWARLSSGTIVICCAAFMAFYIGHSNITLDTNASLFHGASSVFFLFMAIFIYHRVIVLTKEPAKSPEEVNREQAKTLIEKVEVDYE